MSETSMLKAVAPLLADGLDDPVASVMVTWSRGSGTAHARSWTWDLWDKVHPAITAASAWSIATAFGAKAWTLWNQRRGSDDPPAIPPDGWEPDFSTKLPPYEGYEAEIQLPPWKSVGEDE